MPAFRYVVCDVFTDRPLTGNQLAVFTDARKIPEGDLQRLARALSPPETRSVYPPRPPGRLHHATLPPPARRPPLILADEPTGALDVDTGQAVMALLDTVATESGAALITITHDVNVAALARACYRLESGVLTPAAIPAGVRA